MCWKEFSACVVSFFLLLFLCGYNLRLLLHIKSNQFVHTLQVDRHILLTKQENRQGHGCSRKEIDFSTIVYAYVAWIGTVHFSDLKVVSSQDYIKFPATLYSSPHPILNSLDFPPQNFRPLPHLIFIPIH